MPVIASNNVPTTFKDLWDQRVRWFRGFIYNNLKYKKMFMSRKYGVMGRIQFPLNAITFATILLTFFLISYELLRQIYQLITKFILLRSDVYTIFEIPRIKELLLSIDIKYIFP